MAKFTEKQFKTILNKYKFIDNWFWVRYGINPYNGCQFGCVYCDSRSAKYNLPTDFENDIVVKTDPAKMLDKRIANARTLLPDIVGTGSAADPYQPAEKKYENTKSCLEVLLKHKYPVLVGTKSILVLRDIELLDKIGAETWCTIALTVTTANKDKAGFLEKFAPSPDERFNVLNTIKKAAKNIQTGIWMMPIIPGFCDSESDMEDMVKKAKDNGADFILIGTLTMRDLQARWFLNNLNKDYPDLIKKYEELYRFKYHPDFYQGEFVPDFNYILDINKEIFELCDKYGIPVRMKRFIPDDYRKYNYIIAEKLLNKAYMLQSIGKAWSSIFWAGQNIQNLKESVVDIAKRGELTQIRNIGGKIEKFILDEISNN